MVILATVVPHRKDTLAAKAGHHRAPEREQGVSMLVEKQPLSLADIEAQTALELPDREMLALITVVITNVLNNLSVDITVKNNNVAVQLCAAVQLLNTILVGESL